MASKEVKAGAAFVELVVKDNKLTQGLLAASKRIKAWAASTKKYLQGIGSGLMNAGKWGLGIGAGIGAGLFAMTKSFADAGDALDKMKDRTGMTTEFLSEMGHVAKKCGTDIGTLEKAIRKQQTLMLDASRGSQSAINELAELGLSYQQLARLSPEKQFEVLIARLGQMDEAHRAAQAMKLFGTSAQQLMPMINAGTKGIAEMRAEAQRLGLSMSGSQVASAVKLADAMDRLKGAFRGLVNQIGAALAPELISLAEWFTKYAIVIIDTAKRNKQLIVSFAKWTAIIAGVSAGLITLGAVFFGLGAIAGAALGAVATALSIVAGLAAFLVSPIGLAIAAIG